MTSISGIYINSTHDMTTHPYVRMNNASTCTYTNTPNTDETKRRRRHARAGITLPPPPPPAAPHSDAPDRRPRATPTTEDSFVNARDLAFDFERRTDDDERVRDANDDGAPDRGARERRARDDDASTRRANTARDRARWRDLRDRDAGREPWGEGVREQGDRDRRRGEWL